MTRARRGTLRPGLALAGAVVLLDQAVKAVMLYGVFGLPFPTTAGAWHPPIAVTDFFNLVMVWNRGISFGLLAETPGASRWLLIGLALAIAGALTVWLARAADRFLILPLGLVIGGAVGNVIDRVLYGAVADFFDFHLLGYHFWAFNVADSAISVGIALLLLDSLLSRPPADARAAGGKRRVGRSS